MYYYINEQQLKDIVSNAISYGSNKLDERYTLLNRIVTSVKNQELDEVQEEIQTESKKSVIIKDIPSNIKSYSLAEITKENITPYLKKYGFDIKETSEHPKFLIVDWDSKKSVFSKINNGTVYGMDVLFESLDRVKEGTSFRDSASTLLETQEFDWF